MVVVWSARTTETNDDSTTERVERRRKTDDASVVQLRRWKEARFIESWGPIVRLLAIPIGNAGSRHQYRMRFRA